jgi:hypothetical protein
MIGLAIFSVLALNIFSPQTSHTELLALITAVVVPTTLSLLSLMKANESSRISMETHKMVNSRLDDFITSATTIARGEGLKEGMKEGRDEADARTDALYKGHDSVIHHEGGIRHEEGHS